MSYIRVEDVLPKALIETIQKYVSRKVYIFHAKRKKSGEARRKQRCITKYGIKKYA